MQVFEISTGDTIIIKRGEDTIKVQICHNGALNGPGQVRIGIEALRHLRIMRQELIETVDTAWGKMEIGGEG